MQRPETVSDHTTQVGIISVIIGTKCKELGADVDLGKVAIYALFHDAEERITGDIPRPSKYDNPKIQKGLQQLALCSIVTLSEEIKFPPLVAYWREGKSNGLEGLIVSVSDTLQIVKKVIEEVELFSNYSMLDVATEVKKSIAEIRLNVEKAEVPKEVKEFFHDLAIQSNMILNDIIVKYGNR